MSAAKVGKNGQKNSQEYFSFASELGAFAPWREDFQIREFSAPENLPR
jgi:hypothetical protein